MCSLLKEKNYRLSETYSFHVNFQMYNVTVESHKNVGTIVRRIYKKYMREMTSPRWQHRSFLTFLPIRKTIHAQHTTERTLEHRGEAEGPPPPPPRTGKTKTNCIRRVRGGATF